MGFIIFKIFLFNVDTSVMKETQRTLVILFTHSHGHYFTKDLQFCLLFKAIRLYMWNRGPTKCVPKKREKEVEKIVFHFVSFRAILRFVFCPERVLTHVG